MTNNDDSTDERTGGIDSETTDGADRGSSRRRFLGSAAAGGALLAGGAGLTFAQEDDDEDADGPLFEDVEGTDVDVLNYALTLEHLENAFYREALDTFDEETFLESDPLAGFDEEAGQQLYQQLQVIGDHEAAHVEALTQAVEALDGDPVEEGDYEFGLESVDDFLSLAATLENTGVAAYAGAAPAVESPDLLRVALGVHSVEARHAAVVSAAAGQEPFPDVVDEPASQSEVLDAVGPFIAEEGEESEEDEADSGDDDSETETETETDTETGNETTGTETETPGGDS